MPYFKTLIMCGIQYNVIFMLKNKIKLQLRIHLRSNGFPF